jgi:DNA-binding transcriptional ArsR family regulator
MHSGSAAKSHAAVFAALGDETRLAVLARLGEGAPQSISRLTAGTRLSRQAVSKHLRVLEAVGMVRSLRCGRQHVFTLERQPIDDVRRYLEAVSKQWDDALARLQSFVEAADDPTSFAAAMDKSERGVPS